MPTEPSASDPRWRAQIELTIPFHDLDPLDIVWHGNYVRYFEHARTALFQQLDYDVPAMRASGYVWPVIELNIRYARPLRYMQRIVVSATSSSGKTVSKSVMKSMTTPAARV